MYIQTLNFPNQSSIIGFHSRILQTWLRWNKETFIDDFIVDVIIRVAFIFVNLKFYSFIEINFSKVIHYRLFFFIMQERKTNMLWLSFQLAIYFLVNTFYSGGTPSLQVTLALCLHWERVSSHGRHLATYGHQKHCQKNPAMLCLHYSLMIFSSSSKPRLSIPFRSVRNGRNIPYQFKKRNKTEQISSHFKSRSVPDFSAKFRPERSGSIPHIPFRSWKAIESNWTLFNLIN